MLRWLLEEREWRIVNDSPLTVVCFVDARGTADPVQVADDVVADGRTWISSVKFEGQIVLRACITSHFTREEHLRALVDALDQAREAKG
jgi:pectin methylesterase-like acyl-CoA thioesterase